MNTNEALITTLWDLDTTGDIGRATEYDDGSYEADIAAVLIKALQDESSNVIHSHDYKCMYGHYADGHEIEIYWWHTNASSEWSADRPDWWDARGQVEAADAE